MWWRGHGRCPCSELPSGQNMGLGRSSLLPVVAIVLYLFCSIVFLETNRNVSRSRIVCKPKRKAAEIKYGPAPVFIPAPAPAPAPAPDLPPYPGVQQFCPVSCLLSYFCLGLNQSGWKVHKVGIKQN